ncbi:hypothetical protein ANN_14953 [Periplaneta americana]|uniref:Per a allergen n=1 Tax=Periplaneta americana TaxID=6978 RepID=A0ABQ8SYC5_PERAM|nr:hypothetical protein ANN_14953 [Periplaneta americana]
MNALRRNLQYIRLDHVRNEEINEEMNAVETVTERLEARSLGWKDWRRVSAQYKYTVVSGEIERYDVGKQEATAKSGEIYEEEEEEED